MSEEEVIEPGGEEEIEEVEEEVIEGSEEEPGESEQDGEGEGDSPQEAALSEEDLDKVAHVKVNGEEMKMTVRELLEVQQLQKASRIKMQEAASLRKNVEQEAQTLLKNLKENPWAILQKLGHDTDKWAEERVLAKLQEAEMTEEQKRLKELEEKEKHWSLKEKEEKEKETLQAEEKDLVVEQEKLDKEISQAWKDANLPEDLAHRFFKETTQAMYGAALKNQDLTAGDAAAIVKESIERDFRAYADTLSDEALYKLLSDGSRKKLREFDVRRVSQKTAQPFQTSSPGRKPASSKVKDNSESAYLKWKAELEEQYG